ncbi:MAG: hypothetical protein A3F46_10915 [Legionellales bacterium RIFCSPHIGHO2_12_FULL_42_9]|nr:MAG: hypothetical protein A3F46_10915 [Legionellales bacterium RIFCSPHIGHO2_12_FULL_42_9]
MILFKRFKVRSLTKKLKSMQQSRQHSQPSDELLAKEKSIYHQLSRLYGRLKKNKKVPFAEDMLWECLRAATELDDSEAQFKLASRLLDEAKFREQLQKDGVFASASNERQANQLYEEALAYLRAAEGLDHVGAKRLHGLCYINGWGVPVEREKGFDLVVDSIAMENSWDKVPQIFASIGLNKPEFFAALTKHRKV